MHVWRFNKKGNPMDRVELIGKVHLETALLSGKGIQFVSIHHYLSRIFSQWIHQYPSKLSPYLIRQFPGQTQDPLANLYHQQHMEIYGGRLISVESDMRRAVRILKKGGSIVLLQDRFKMEAPPSKFLGRTIRASFGSVRLAELSDSILLPVIVTNKGWNRDWIIHFYPIIQSKGEKGRSELSECLEQMILTYPEAWEHWFRFLKLPKWSL
jgi:lauroyl/myristoyl acyltransferase